MDAIVLFRVLFETLSSRLRLPYNLFLPVLFSLPTKFAYSIVANSAQATRCRHAIRAAFLYEHFLISAYTTAHFATVCATAGAFAHARDVHLFAWVTTRCSTLEREQLPCVTPATHRHAIQRCVYARIDAARTDVAARRAHRIGNRCGGTKQRATPSLPHLVADSIAADLADHPAPRTRSRALTRSTISRVL